MDDGDKNWVKLPKYNERYLNGVKDFIEKAFAGFSVGNELSCPCKKCSNRFWHRQNIIHDHLVCNGPCPSFVDWIYEVSISKLNSGDDQMDYNMDTGLGDDFDAMMYNINNLGTMDESGLKIGLNSDARKFYRLVEEGKQPLYTGSKKFTRLSFIVRLYLLKCIHGFSEAAFSDILELIKEAFPDINVPTSFKGAKNIIRDLGLDYQKIHACPNDCMLFWGQNESENECKKCGASRWRRAEKNGADVDNKRSKKEHKIPMKVMRYFPLKPRLQRMFLSADFSKLMRWHVVARKKDGKLRHPADGKGWKSIDAKYPEFGTEIRNVKLGLASDGFNPYRTMSTTHSTWPIILTNYNLPPWLSMKPENLILSTIIPGPNHPGNEIDVYMQPLIAELKELWEVGIECYYVLADSTFMLHATILWAISDFPGYAMLSGWKTKGKLACPICNYCTSSIYLKHSKKVCYLNHRKFLDPNHKWRFDKKRFNGEVEAGTTPEVLSGKDIEELLCDYKNDFGKQKKKQKSNSDCPWTKKSIFFELP